VQVAECNQQSFRANHLALSGFEGYLHKPLVQDGRFTVDCEQFGPGKALRQREERDPAVPAEREPENQNPANCPQLNRDMLEEVRYRTYIRGQARQIRIKLHSELRGKVYGY